MPPHTSYRHAQLYRALWLVLPVIALLTGLLPSFTGEPDPWPEALIGPVVLMGTLVALGQLVIEVRGSGPTAELVWRFGWLPWPRWRQPLAEVQRVERSQAPRSGSGIKGDRAHRIYSTQLGSPAVTLHLRDGRRITLGTPEPERLQAVIEARLSV